MSCAQARRQPSPQSVLPELRAVELNALITGRLAVLLRGNCREQQGGARKGARKECRQATSDEIISSFHV